MSNVMGYGAAGSSNPLTASANHGGQQFPRINTNQHISESAQYALTPTALHIVDRADSVWVKTSRTNMKFYFGAKTGQEAGVFATSNAINFGMVGTGEADVSGSNVMLNIKPTGWTSDAAATGDVIFIYNSKKK